MKITIHHQNVMISLRKEMGWPLFRPANDCIAFTSGRALDFEVGIELGRIAGEVGKDVIYSSWAHAQAKRPLGFSLAYRGMISIDIINQLIPYAANDTAPVVLVSIRNAETFAVDNRGSLQRLPGKPTDLAAGRRRATRRIAATAKGLGDELLASNRWVPAGAAVEPDVPAEVLVRFG